MKFASGSTFGTLQVQRKQDASTCGKINIEQESEAGANNSLLEVSVELNNDATTHPDIIFSRADSSERIAGTVAKGKWLSKPRRLKTGSWKIEYRSGNKFCSSNNLTEVICMEGFEEKGGECTAVPTSKGTNLQIILGACMGVVLASCLVLLGYLGRRNPAKIKKIFLSFMRTEVKLALKIFFEAWDFFTENAGRQHVVFFAIASVVSAVSMWLKIKAFVEQLRERRRTIFDETEEQTGHQRKLKASTKKLVKTNRQINLLYTSMMIGAAECIPLGILQSMQHRVACAYLLGAC